VTLGTGYCLCSDGYYDDLTNALCQKCYYKCKKCSQFNLCDECDDTREINSTGMCVCKTMKYDTGTDQVCPSCEPTCLTCTNSTGCASCDVTLKRTFDLAKSFFCVCAAKHV
jgi:proprotein convertase subtilisin/kexin type 5